MGLRRHLLEVLEEAAVQDRKVAADPPEVWTPHRNGVRSYLTAIEDEVREAREAWDSEKKPAGEADPARWPKTRAELVQVAAASLRAVRSLSPELATGVGGSTEAGAGAKERELLFDAGDIREADLLGVPLSEIAALTIDGAHWFEVFGPTLRRSSPLGGPILRFRIAQAPGGKKARLGVSQGATVAVREDAVRGVQRKGDESPLGPPVRENQGGGD